MTELAQIIRLPDGNGGANTITGPLAKNPSSIGDLFNLNGNLLNIIIFVAGVVLLMYIIYGGFKYLTAQGDPKAMDAARNTITYAVIGFGIVAFAFLIMQIAQLFFGFKIVGIDELIPPTYAQGVSIGDSLKIGDKTISQAFPSIGALVSRVLQFAIPIAGIVFLVFLVIGGMKWVTSQGDKGAVQSARGTLTTAVIGLVIVVGSFIVLQAIELITGFKVTGR